MTRLYAPEKARLERTGVQPNQHPRAGSAQGGGVQTTSGEFLKAMQGLPVTVSCDGGRPGAHDLGGRGAVQSAPADLKAGGRRDRGETEVVRRAKNARQDRYPVCVRPNR
jgi:hypothetical protein